MKSFTPIDLERRSFTGLLIYLGIFAKDNTLRNTHEMLRDLGQTFG